MTTSPIDSISRGTSLHMRDPPRALRSRAAASRPSPGGAGGRPHRRKPRYSLAGAGGDGTALGQPVAGLDAAVEDLLQAVDQFRRRGRAAQHDALHAGDIVLPQRGAVEERIGHGGDEGHAGGLLVLDQPEDFGRSKRRTITCFSPLMVEVWARPQPFAWNSGMVCSST